MILVPIDDWAFCRSVGMHLRDLRTGVRSFVRGLVLGAPMISSESPVPGTQEFADIVRLLRLLVGQVEATPSGVVLTRESVVYRAVCGLLDATPEQRAATRTAIMILRDLLWRADTVRSMLESRMNDPAIAEAVSLLETADVHQFLRQEP